MQTNAAPRLALHWREAGNGWMQSSLSPYSQTAAPPCRYKYILLSVGVEVRVCVQETLPWLGRLATLLTPASQMTGAARTTAIREADLIANNFENLEGGPSLSAGD